MSILNIPQKITADTESASDALRRASRLEADSKKLLTRADELLKETALPVPRPSTLQATARTPQTVNAAREAMETAYSQVQQADVRLKKPFRELIQAQFAERQWREALTKARALQRIDPTFADFSEYSGPLKPIFQMEFIRIPGGEFKYGDNNQTQRTDEYEIGKTPVTNEQFNTFVELTRFKWDHRDDNPEHSFHPVVRVSWNDAVAFCQWVSEILAEDVRLPTEQEWEKAARGTDGRRYPWGNQEPDSTHCNFNNNVGTTTPVGKYAAVGESPYTCIDMAGNVWEWTSSLYDASRHVVRGGSWNNGATSVLATCRLSNNADFRSSDRGFRVAVSLRKG